ncbi:hypothetical protein [Dysgonomonas sp. BGC7]|uniref:hypothetical protein n=1 Tax=Dysgonomonas sp. BGC7 TaxID=1658008 RepID=UPI000A84560F|nr:hypothetical protein [Dysgonomonas sp. BGC7]MBD8387617.1 hypothetical protein [Dysgonomonas sp. BGC7]
MTLQPRISVKDKKYDCLIFLFALTALSLFMVCWSGPISEYAGHDYYFNTIRFGVLIDNLKSGTYPIYIDSNALDGYGYFTKAFYPDLILLPFALLGILTGAGFAYLAMIFSLTILCGLFMYKAMNTVFESSVVATIGSILYTFSAYHLFDWYNRGALGEAISFTFLPIIFLGLYQIIVGDYKKWYLLTIGYSLLIYTHLLSSFITFITLAIIVLMCIKPLLKEPKRIAYLLLAALVTLPLVASYLFPMLEQMASNTFHYSLKENITGQTKLGFVDMAWGSLSGIFYSKENNLCGTGPLLIIAVILRLFVKFPKIHIRIADLSLFIGVFYMICISSVFPWGRLPLGFIQFPWRLYEFVTFFFAIAGAYYVFCLLRTRKQFYVIASVVIVFAVVTIVVNNNSYQYWQSKTKAAAPEWFTGIPSVENEYYQGGLEYLPISVPSYHYIHQRGDSVKSQLSTTEIISTNRDGGVINIQLSLTSADNIELPLVYYKGYKAILNTRNVEVGESKSGLVEVSVAESGNLTVYYADTLVQKFSWYISLVSILLLIVYIWFYRKKKTIE